MIQEWFHLFDRQQILILSYDEFIQISAVDFPVVPISSAPSAPKSTSPSSSPTTVPTVSLAPSDGIQEFENVLI